jgi:hypothetical protein
MTRSDLVDWLTQNGCKIDTLPEVNNSACGVIFYNPANNLDVWISTPIDDRSVPAFLIYETCALLGIPIPDCVNEQKDISKELKNRFGNK